MVTINLHLYESRANLENVPFWTHKIRPLFELLESTSGIDFKVYRDTLQQIHCHARIALAFEFPALLHQTLPAK